MLSLRKRGSALLAICAALLVGAVAAAADSAVAPKETYSWSAELVEIDRPAGTITVRALVAGHANLDELPSLREGERVIITWSGLTRGTAVRGVTRGAEALDGLVLRAQFISSERDDRYLVFRVPVPEQALARIGGLSAGEWVTLESPRSRVDWNEAVVQARPYNDVG